MKLKMILLSLLAGTSTTLYADSLGTAFTYQGQLSVSGAPANGTYDFIFALYNSSSSGSEIGSPVITNGLSVSNGLFSTALDFGSQFNGTASWLAISVRSNNTGNYVVLAPRQALAPTPNALFSSTSGTAGLAASVSSASVTGNGIASSTITAGNIASGQVVKSLNGLEDAVTLAQGNNVTITPSGNTLTIAAAGGQAVTSLNGLQGALILAGNSDISVSAGAGTLTFGTTATSANAASTMVKRDASGNFSAGSITLANNMYLPATTAGSGIIYYGGTPFLHAFGSLNFFGGFGAGNLTAAGLDNVGIGASALSQSSGNANTAIGYQAMSGNNTGNANIALGVSAGSQLTTGNHNICIGNPGVAGDTGTIRIGDQNTYSAVIAGIYGNNIANAIPVYIGSSGSLGTAASSAQFKQNIQSMGDTSDVLLNLRPVTFQYKSDIDPEGIPQYGLVAEDVEKVNPELVVHDAKHGIYTVRYQAIDAMLLNEFLKEHKIVEAQAREIDRLREKTDKVDSLKSKLEQLETIVKSLSETTKTK